MAVAARCWRGPARTVLPLVRERHWRIARPRAGRDVSAAPCMGLSLGLGHQVAGRTWDSSADPAIWLADYKAVRVKVWRRAAAFYVGDHSNGFCQTGEKHPSTPVQGSCPVEVDDSYASLTNGPDNTATDRYHTEAIQCYGGDQVTANHDTFDTTDASHGTSSFFCPSGQGNTAAYVNGMLVMNGSNVPGTTNVDGTLSNYDCCGFAFRDGVPGTVNNGLISSFGGGVGSGMGGRERGL